MENLAAFNAREVREQQQRKEKERSIPLQKDSESQIKRQNQPNEPSENFGSKSFVGVKDRRKGDSRKIGR